MCPRNTETRQNDSRWDTRGLCRGSGGTTPLLPLDVPNAVMSALGSCVCSRRDSGVWSRGDTRQSPRGPACVRVETARGPGSVPHGGLSGTEGPCFPRGRNWLPAGRRRWCPRTHRGPEPWRRLSPGLVLWMSRHWSHGGRGNKGSSSSRPSENQAEQLTERVHVEGINQEPAAWPPPRPCAQPRTEPANTSANTS